MTELVVGLDPLNPGQFFASCGLLELVALACPSAIAAFESPRNQPRRAHFNIEAPAISLGTVLEHLRESALEFPDEHIEAAVRPVQISYSGTTLMLDWWLNEFREKTVPLKCWAGQVTTQRLFSELLPLLDLNVGPRDLFDSPQMTKSKFGLDPRSAWNTLDFGFSPNEHGRDSAVFPAVEILAAIGLQTFRPDVSDRTRVPYSLWESYLPAPVARQAFRYPWDGLPARRCEFAIQQRGQSYKYFAFATDLKESVVE